MRPRLVAVGLLALALALAARAAPAEDAPPRHEVVAEVASGPGNLSVAPDGRILLSLHPFFGPRLRVVVAGRDGTLEPFPDEAWASAAEDRISLDAVLGIQVDTEGVAWLLDNGLRGGVTPKLVAWDLASDALHRVIHLPPPLTRADSFVNDLAVDRSRGTIYVADPAGGADAALIVVDLATGAARRVLEGHVSVVPEDVDLVIDGTPVEVLTPDGERVRPRIGVNPIALDAAGAWLYFGPMHGTSLYRVPTAALRDAARTPDALAQAVERYASKPICDGISVDDEGNVYVTDVANDAVGVIPAEGRTYRILARDPVHLSWPDALSFGPDGRLYTVSNQLHRTARLNGGVDATKPPFYVVRIEPLAPGVPGR